MKLFYFILAFLICGTTAIGQVISSHIGIITAYSQNQRFYLESVPFDNRIPTLSGKTIVYNKSDSTPLYILNRGFSFISYDNNLILSNDGRVIFSTTTWGADEEIEGLKSITIYRDGNLLKDFTESEITGCNYRLERCSLVYSNFDEVVDREKSNYGTQKYRKVFKDGVGEKEKFLSDFAILNIDDTVYITDSKKKVHIFNLKDGLYVGAESFDDIFEQLKGNRELNKVEIKTIKSPNLLEFPKLIKGKKTDQVLASHLGMKATSLHDSQFKLYRFKLDCRISRDGSLEITNMEFYDDLPKEKIIEFFKINKFDISSVPEVFDEWNLYDKYFYLRKPNVTLQIERTKVSEKVFAIA